MKVQISFGVIALASLATLAPARSQERPAAERPAHQWPLEERLQRRLDADAAQERIAYALATKRLAQRPPIGSIYVDGGANPELLLPWEIFQQLILQGTVAPAPGRSAYRDYLDEARQRLGLPANFWAGLETAAAPLIRSLRDQSQLAEEVQNGKVAGIDSFKELQRDDCANRARGLAAARRLFGPERFDRFLYEAVAPTMTIVGDASAGDAQRLQWIADGCP